MTATVTVGQGSQTMPGVNHNMPVWRNPPAAQLFPRRHDSGRTPSTSLAMVSHHPPWGRPAANLRWMITKLHNVSVMPPPWFGSRSSAVWGLTLFWMETMLITIVASILHPEFTGLRPNQTSAPVSSMFGPCLKPPSQPGLDLKSLYPHGTQLCF